MDFRERHIVVTGGAGALGAAVVAALAAQGAICHVPFRSERNADALPFRAGKTVTLYPGIELSDEKSVARLYAGVPELWASVHVAGGFAAGTLAATGKAVLMRQIETNLVSTFLCCRAAVNAMRDRGGRIVNVAARPALEWRAGAGMTAYTAAKVAVAALTAALAEEVARDGILVNAVAPSIMDTPANRAAMPKADHDAWPKVEDVAAAILFLASPENTATRGAIVPVYGKA